MSLKKGFEDLEHYGEVLFQAIKGSKVEDFVRTKNEIQQRLFQHHTDTKTTITQLLNGMERVREGVEGELLAQERQKSELSHDLQSLEQDLLRNAAKNQTTEAELQFLQSELKSLKDSEDEVQTLQAEVDEDTTEIIPSAVYLAQLYYKVSRIKWEHGDDPGVLKGVHYSPDLTTPINIDLSSQSKCSVTDYLWSFVSADW